MKISIIIPVYNKGQYLNKCLQSIKNQSFKNFEVIIIDDGSTDNSINIIDTYIRNDKRFTKIESNHMGVGNARNKGLSNVNGDWVVFVDADDYLDSDYLNKMIENSQKYDLVVSGLKYDKNGNVGESIVLPTHVFESSQIKHIFTKSYFPILTVPYCKMYKMNIIKKFDVKFENIQYGEDTLFTINYLKYVKKISLLNYCGYYNRIINGTLSRKENIDVERSLNEQINLIQDIWKIGYQNEWTYLYLRNIKLILLNYKYNFYKFSNTCKNYRKKRLFKKIKLKNIDSLSDLFVYLMLVFKLDLILFLLYLRKV